MEQKMYRQLKVSRRRKQKYMYDKKPMHDMERSDAYMRELYGLQWLKPINRHRTDNQVPQTKRRWERDEIWSSHGIPCKLHRDAKADSYSVHQRVNDYYEEQYAEARDEFMRELKQGFVNSLGQYAESNLFLLSVLFDLPTSDELMKVCEE